MRFLLAITVLAACGTDTPSGADAPPSDGFAALVHYQWTLPTSSEDFICIRQTVTRDMYIRSLRPIAPSGTHHEVLGLGAPDGPDGVTHCPSMQPRSLIYGAGVGSEQLDLPEGIALHARPGQQLILNLHLYNATEATLTGDSGIDILETTAAEVVHEAGAVLVGKTAGLQVVTGASTQTGVCTTPAGTTLVAVGPHMHRLGSHLKVTYEGAGGVEPLTVYDRPYNFDSQVFRFPDVPVTTTAGGKITVTCSYMNPGPPVGYGESTDDEMCFAGIIAYPPPAGSQCTK